jgi:hypothetical protein
VCTHGQLLFPKEQNLVFDVDIPCIGSTSLGPYNLRTGNGYGPNNIDNELYGLVELAREHLQVGGCVRACVCVCVCVCAPLP